MAAEYPDTPRLAVGGVVIRGDEVLLVLRGNPPSEGEWAIPGGSVALGETLREAVERELREETGVRVMAGEPVHVVDAIVKDPDGRVRFHYVVVDLAATFLAGDPHPGDDALDARWVSRGALSNLKTSRKSRELLTALGFLPQPDGSPEPAS